MIVPVETIPLAVGPVTRKLKALGLTPTVRLSDGKTFITDNGNVTLDCASAIPIAPIWHMPTPWPKPPPWNTNAVPSRWTSNSVDLRPPSKRRM